MSFIFYSNSKVTPVAHLVATVLGIALGLDLWVSMTEYHRKIELQSPEDLQYLVANARRAAQEHLDQLFPPSESPGGEDPMRGPIEKNVQQYLNDVFTVAAPNITINGLDITPDLLHSILTSQSTELEIEEHESFDSRLHERAKALQQEENDLIEEIAKLKRTVPNTVVEGMKKSYRGVEEDEEVLGRVMGKMGERVRGEESVEANVGKLERQEDVERMFRGGVKGDAGLRWTLPELVAKKERAEEVERHVLKEGMS